MEKGRGGGGRPCGVEDLVLLAELDSALVRGPRPRSSYTGLYPHPKCYLFRTNESGAMEKHDHCSDKAGYRGTSLIRNCCLCVGDLVLLAELDGALVGGPGRLLDPLRHLHTGVPRS